MNRAAVDRVTGADEAYLAVEQLFGLSALGQYSWIFQTPPDHDAVAAFCDQLASGSLSRKVVAAVVPFARHRWVRSPYRPVVHVDPAPIPDGEIGAWLDRTLRGADLDPVAGKGWQLTGVATTSGRFVLSFVASHMIVDGQGMFNVLAAAHAGVSASMLITEDRVRGRARWQADLRDSLGQLAAAASAVRIICTELWRQRRRGRPAPARTRPEGVVPGAREESDTTLAIVDIDRDRWTARAKEFGGTGASLFTAILGGLVRRSGHPVGEDGLRICIAVSDRTDGDERANASGGVWIRVPGEISPGAGLQEIRALSKQAFHEHAVSGSDKLAANLQPLVRLLPKRVIRKHIRSTAGPDVTVSRLGAAPDSALEIGGRRAESFAIRAIIQGRSMGGRRRQGPALAAWAVEYDNKVTITFFGVHPDYFGDSDALRTLIDAELDAWGMTASRW